MQPVDYTPRFLISLRGDLHVWCGTCRWNRGVDLARLATRRWMDEPFRNMKFRCSRCGAAGEAEVNWTDSGGGWKFSYRTLRKRLRDNPSIYPPPHDR